MNEVNNIERMSGFQFHLGGNIGGDAPAVFGIDQSTPILGTRMFCTGIPGKWCDGEAYIIIPWQLGPSGKVNLSFDRLLDNNSLWYGQAHESDIKFESPDGFEFNGSMQIVQADGRLQISDATGDWKDTGYKVPEKTTPNVWHHYLIQYQLDIVKHTYSIISITIDDDTYYIPPTMGNLPAIRHDPAWKIGAMIQMQMDTNEKGGTIQQYINNMKLTWL